MKNLILIIPLIIAVMCSSTAQERIIRGRITEKATGQPVIGASVVVQETNKSTSTDVNGAFSVHAATGQTIRVTYIGFETALVKVTNSNEVVIQLDEAAASLLSEVVVTGYQSQRKKDLT
uniref:carboxypeptidase-like regulatory domain-containing protein n=1 Tax=Arcticibacter sp. TaxID=1872630 RepID=UPI00389064A4